MPHDPSDPLERALAEATSLQEQTRSLLLTLSDQEVADPEEFDRLHALSKARDRAIFQIGRIIMGAVQEGLTVVLFEEVPLAPPVETPEPEGDEDTPTPPTPVVARLPTIKEALAAAPLPLPPRNIILPPPPSAGSVRALHDSLAGIKKVTPPKPNKSLREVVALLPPPNALTEGAVHSLTKAIERVTTISMDLAEWVPFTKDDQLLLTTYLVAVARYYQESVALVGAPEYLHGEVNRLFPRITAFSEAYRPGFIWGLSLKHEPPSGSWLEEAQKWWAEIQRLVEASAPIGVGETNPEKLLTSLAFIVNSGSDTDVRNALYRVLSVVSATDPRVARTVLPRKDALENEPRFKAVRRAIRLIDQGEETPDPEEVEENATPEALLAVTRGVTAVLVGGEPVPDAQERIRAEFEFGSVDWIVTDPRKVEALAERVRSGTVNVVIFLARFVSHKWQDILFPACKESEVPFAIVQRGYGVSAVRGALKKAMLGIVE